jgi:hypothetical protein
MPAKSLPSPADPFILRSKGLSGTLAAARQQ